MKRKEIFQFCFNIALALLELTGLILLFTVGIERIVDGQKVLVVAKATTFKWFTTDSNILMLLVSILFIIFMILKWNNKIKKIPTWLNILKLIATAMLAITMFVILVGVIVYPYIRSEVTIKGFYMGSNLLFHLICPIVAIVSYLLFDDAKEIPILKTLYAFIPVVIYAIFYMSMAYTHMNPDGTFQKGYDWYSFCKFGPIATPSITIAVLGFFYLFTWTFWIGNRKINLKFLQDNNKKRLHK